jgi:pimeloyl-ACP methyl ester carboxylesterase
LKIFEIGYHWPYKYKKRKVNIMPYVNNQGVKIHYEVEGQGPPLVLMTGLAGTLDDWRLFGYSQVLSKDYRLILIDPRGRGASDKPHDAAAYDLKLMVEDVVAILDDLKIKKAHYFGYSWGGMIGWRVPIYAPERFLSLILGGSRYPLQGREEMDSNVATALQVGLEMAFKEAPDRPMEFFVAAVEKSMGSQYPPERRAQMLALDPHAVLASFQGVLQGVIPKAEDVLPRVTLPCLIFAGEADPWYPKARECANLMPNATFFSLPGIGHEALERSDLVLPHISKFLAEVSKK